jgi:hypothetical protein
MPGGSNGAFFYCGKLDAFCAFKAILAIAKFYGINVGRLTILSPSFFVTPRLATKFYIYDFTAGILNISRTLGRFYGSLSSIASTRVLSPVLY